MLSIKKRTLIIWFFGLTIVSILGIALLTRDQAKIDSGNVLSLVNITSVSAQEFEIEIEESEAVLIDIRTPEEYSKGKIEGAINIDYYAANFKNELSKLDKTKSYKVYCNSGKRSAEALKIMRNLGFYDVVELQGGFQAWFSNGLPTCTKC